MKRFLCCLLVFGVCSMLVIGNTNAGQVDIPDAPAVAGQVTSQIGGPVIVSQTTQQLSQTVSNYPGYAMQHAQAPGVSTVCSSVGLLGGLNLGLNELELRPIVIKLLLRKIRGRRQSSSSSERTVIRQNIRTRLRDR